MQRSAINLAILLFCLIFLGTNGCKSSRSMSSLSMPPETDSISGVSALPADKEGVAVPDFTTNATDRLMIYEADMIVVVRDVNASLEKLREVASRLKGFMQDMTEKSIVLRIPANRFNEAMREVDKIGEVTGRHIKGTDVTEEMTDLDIRLKNMEQVRDNLTKLLAKGDKVEDLLKIEKELESVTESIETMKGRVKYLQHHVDYSTLRIQFNTPVLDAELQEVIPAKWIRSLGSDITRTANMYFESEWHMFTWLNFDLPKEYVELYEGDNSTRAMSGDAVVLLVKREPNLKKATLEFWSRVIHRWLAASRTIAIIEEKNIELNSKAAGRMTVGTQTVGRKTYQYMLALVVKDNYVYTYECWGPADQVTKDREQIELSIKSMKISP